MELHHVHTKEPVSPVDIARRDEVVHNIEAFDRFVFPVVNYVVGTLEQVYILYLHISQLVYKSFLSNLVLWNQK